MRPTRALVATLLAVAACHEAPRSEPQQPPAGEVWITEQQLRDGQFGLESAAVRPVGSVVPVPARIAFDDLKVSHVFSPVTGRVARVLAQPGERVRAGTPLAVILSPDLGQALSDLAKAEADLGVAEKELVRQRELYEARAGARRDLEAAEGTAAKARAEFERAREKAGLLRVDQRGRSIQEYEIRAPIDGEVISRTINPGAEVQGQYGGGQAAELFTVGDLSSVWVFGDVFGRDLPGVEKGAPLELVMPAFPGRTFQTKVDWISGALDPASRTARVRASLANPDRALRPEMIGTALVTVRPRDALAVPRRAVLRVGDGLAVFVEAGKAPDGRLRFERRTVQVDDRGGDWLPIVKGLAPGDRVVSDGAIQMLGLL